MFEYTGELDQKGKACGFGVAVDKKDTEIVYEGTFLDNKKQNMLT